MSSTRSYAVGRLAFDICGVGSLCVFAACQATAPASAPEPAASASGVQSTARASTPEPAAPSQDSASGVQPTSEPDSARPSVPTSGCQIDLDASTGRLRIDGVAQPDHRFATLRKALGRPDRVEDVSSRERYEEFGGDGSPPSSQMVDVTTRYYVYDELGLVLRTEGSSVRRGKARPDPVMLLLFFPHPRRFTNTAAPAVVPRRRGGCALAFDGRVLDSTVDMIPAGTTYDTDAFEVLGRTFGPTSIATKIDSAYSWEPDPAVQIYLDDETTRRPSYAQIHL